jgi:hypothetical protein
MTRAQVESALTGTGNSTGEWISLENDFKYLLMGSDKNSFVSPRTVQFYFSDEYDYFLTRHLYGPAVQVESGDPIPEGYGRVFHDEEYYDIEIEPGGVEDQSDDDAGVYHTLTAFSSISGIFKK